MYIPSINSIYTRWMYSSQRRARLSRVFLCICVLYLYFICNVFGIDVYAAFNLLPDEEMQRSVEVLLDNYDDDDGYIELDQSVSALEESMRMYAQDIENMEIKFADVIEHQEVAQQEYALVSQEFTNTQKEINDRAVYMRLTQGKIEQMWAIKDALAKDLFALKRYVSIYSRIVLKQQQKTWDWHSSLLDSFLSWEVWLDIWQEQMMQILMKNLWVAMSEVATQQTSYYIHLQDLYAVAAEFQSIDVNQKDRLAVLQSQLQSLEWLLNNLQQDRKTINEYVKEIKYSEELLQQTVRDLEEDLANKSDFLADFIRDISQKNKLPERSWRSVFLSWPIHTLSELLYNVPRFVPYHGISLAAKQWDEIYAPAWSIVIDMYHSGDRSLSWILLWHEDGSSTLMYPLSDIYIWVWDVVSRGSIIWAVWWTTGTIGSGRGSTQAHVTIHILRDGDVMDPLQELDVSVWWDMQSLPLAYHDQYKTHRDNRPVYVHDVRLISGENERARASAYLANNAGPAFSDPSMWYSGAQGTGVDPLMGICIAAAETSRRNFASSNNIWNVGNNDRGDRVAYTSPSQAVKAIYQTLSNRYLGAYTQLSQFSRFGNKTWSIYASDPTNRQRNVQRCLVSLTHTYYDEEYFVRRVN